MLGRPLLYLHLRLLCLCLIRVFCDSSAICVPGLSAPSSSSLSCPLRLRLHLLCLCLVCIFCGSSAVCVLGLSAPSAFFVSRPLRLRLRLLRLCLCLRFFLLCQCCWFLFYFYLVSLNQGHLHQVRS